MKISHDHREKTKENFEESMIMLMAIGPSV